MNMFFNGMDFSEPLVLSFGAFLAAAWISWKNPPKLNARVSDRQLPEDRLLFGGYRDDRQGFFRDLTDLFPGFSDDDISDVSGYIRGRTSLRRLKVLPIPVIIHPEEDTYNGLLAPGQRFSVDESTLKLVANFALPSDPFGISDQVIGAELFNVLMDCGRQRMILASPVADPYTIVAIVPKGNTNPLRPLI